MVNQIKYRKVNKFGRIPRKATKGSSGFDLFSSEDKIIPPTIVKDKYVDVGHALVKTGIVIELPDTIIGKIGSRSGMSSINNIEVGAGWIDSDYRGELKIELKNLSGKEFLIEKGQRIAQLILFNKEKITFVSSKKLSITKRGIKGFGSSGK